MFKKKNRKSPVNSNYYNNNSTKRFDYTMNKLYKVIEDQENKKVNTEFFAKIISGNETGDTTYFGTSIFNTSFFTVNDPMVYNIRFLEPYLEYNYGLTDPMFIEDENERNVIIQNHPEAFFLESSFFSSPPVVGARVLVTDKNNDGIYRIERLLDENEGPTEDSFAVTTDSSPSSAFFNPQGSLGFLNNFIGFETTSLDEPEVKFTGKRRYSKTKSVNMEGKTYRPYVRRYVGQAQKYKNTDIENGVKISDLHVKIIGFTEYHSPFFLPDLVDGFKQMCEAYEAKFGKKIRLTDGFRSWKGQIRTRKKKGDAAARPGTSNHGWGLAFDWDTTDSNGTAGYESETYKWMLQNAPKYGFHNPFWAQKPNGWPKVKKAPKGQKGSKPEWWHFEWKFPGKIFK